VYDIVHIAGLNALIDDPFHLLGQPEELNAALCHDQRDQANTP
jgi:hypothetical protein